MTGIDVLLRVVILTQLAHTEKYLTVEIYLFILSYHELKFPKILSTFYICRITIFLVASCE